MFYQKINSSPNHNTVRLDFWLVRALELAVIIILCVVAKSASSTKAVILFRLAFRLSPFLNRGLHLDFEVLQWLKLVEIWGTLNE